MPQHFVHYVPRRIVVRFPREAHNPWFAGVQTLSEGFLHPVFHTTRRITGPTRAVKPGDTIWILSQVFSPWGVLPPGLDARINVDRIEKENDGTLRYVAANTSSWFPLADITGLLACLEWTSRIDQAQPSSARIKLRIGYNFQSMRHLASPTSLEDWSRTLLAEQTHFISYRICDGTSSAFRKVRDLLAQGEAVFWDRWCLPRRLAERREVVDDGALDEHLMMHLRQAKVVRGIESRKYAAYNSYSAKERAEAIHLGTYRPVKVNAEQRRCEAYSMPDLQQ